MRAWWWLWVCCPGLGSARLSALRSLAEKSSVGPDELWGWSRDQLRDALAWPESLLDSVERYRAKQGQRPDLTVPADVLLPGDPLWPDCLNLLDRPPPLLHCRGRRSLLNRLQLREAIAVVAARSASNHGLAVAEDLGRALARAGWPVISGLAEGIDAAVHHGCLAEKGSPIGILGTPLDRIYPAHHRSLQERVGVSGLLLSEHGPGSAVRRGHFAARNRLVAQFARALVVVECPERSGALISARFAMERSCPVWAVPGDARRWSCQGSNALLQDQAAPLLQPVDFARQLGPGPLTSGDGTSRQRELLEAVGEGSSFDDLVKRLQCPPGDLAVQLFELECRGELLCESGLNWKKRRP